MKVALVHDYLGEFGGSERVLAALAEMFPQAPIYTAFWRPGKAYERFKDRDIRVSWAHHIPFFSTKLHSPLRFLSPLIWESFDFTGYDLVISSCSWYITKGILTRPETVHISYIHTPPRYLYGYPTSIEWQKYWLIRIYANVVNHFMRQYDFAAAQRPDVLVANSENTRRRIKKFYRREAKVVYPPVELVRMKDEGRRTKERGYFLVVSRVVGGKGLELAVRACSELGLPLKVVGEPAGWSGEYNRIRQMASSTVEFLGFVSDEELIELYSGAKAFLATACDEDFGMTVVEAQLCGTPVIAYRGGGYLETVVEARSASSRQGPTGVFFDEYSMKGLKRAISDFLVKPDPAPRDNFQTIVKNAKRFSKERFVKEMKKVINKVVKGKLVLHA